MKIERLDANLIRVIVTEADLEKLDMSIEKLQPTSSELHMFLFKIMERIEMETGFNPYNGQIRVDARPSSDGVVLLVTKIGAKIDKKALREKYRNFKGVKKKENVKTRTYGFKEFSSFCSALKNISSELLWNSILYKMDNTYYFVISTKANIDKFHNVISEFCDEYKYPKMYSDILAEHGRIIAQNDTLVKMREEIAKLY